MVQTTRPPEASSSPQRGPAKPLEHKLVTLLALASLVAIFALDSYVSRNSKGGPLTSAPFWLPYLFVALRMRKRPRSALALAIAMSCAMALPAAWLIWYARSWDADWRIQAGLSVIVMAQVVLAVAALRAWRKLPSGESIWKPVIANGAYAAVALFILVSFLGHVPNRIAEDEASAVYLLHVIHKATRSYAAEFGVYPAHLAALNGPPGDVKPDCNAFSLLSLPVSDAADDSFQGYPASGQGYAFDYQPGASEKSPTACLGVKSYQLHAHPLVYRKTGGRSFLLDETGTVRWTREDRAARVSDTAEPMN